MEDLHQWAVKPIPKYLVKCKHCKSDVERSSPRKDATCFTCKTAFRNARGNNRSKRTARLEQEEIDLKARLKKFKKP